MYGRCSTSKPFSMVKQRELTRGNQSVERPNTTNYDNNRENLSSSKSHKIIDTTDITAYSESNMYGHCSQSEQFNQRKQTEAIRFDADDDRRFYEFAHSTGDYQLLKNYEERITNIKTALLDKFQFYYHNPNKHPKFKIEYEKFLKESNTNLLSNGEIPSLNNNDQKFIEFWGVRLKKMYQHNFEKEKFQLRQQLKYVNKINKRATSTNPEKLTSLTYNRNLPTTNTALRSVIEPLMKKTKIKVSSGKNIIQVLRHLSVLEAYLGSLGPKVIDMLYHAIKIEKKSYHCTQIMLSNEENYLTLTMIREKLKGLLETGILEQPFKNVCKTAVSNISSLLNSTSSREQGIEKACKIDRKPVQGEIIIIDDKNDYQNEMKFHKERSLYSDKNIDKRCHEDEKQFYDRIFTIDERKTNLDQRKCTDDRKLLTSTFARKDHESKPHDDKKISINKRNFFHNLRNTYDMNCRTNVSSKTTDVVGKSCSVNPLNNQICTITSSQSENCERVHEEIQTCRTSYKTNRQSKNSGSQPLFVPYRQTHPLVMGLSGAGVRWYRRYVKLGFKPEEARRKAEERRLNKDKTPQI